MKKLTQGQKEAIITLMKQQREVPYWRSLIGPSEFKFMESVIDFYTEKEFPELIMYTENNERIVEIEQDKEDISIYCPLSLSPEQFKEFAAGCNKIAEWLEEQE